jgi:hypothetical protein
VRKGVASTDAVFSEKVAAGGLLAGVPAVEVCRKRRKQLLAANLAANRLGIGQVAASDELEVGVTPDQHLDRHRRTTRKSPRWVAASECSACESFALA